MCGRKTLRAVTSRIAAIIGFGVVLSAASVANAQTAGFVGIEGHITDRATGRPVAGARAVFRQTIDGVAVRDSTVVTDESGFYQFELQPLPGAENSVYVWCQSPKGDTTTTVPLYATLNNGSVYVRNVPIALPKKYTRCVPS